MTKLQDFQTFQKASQENPQMKNQLRQEITAYYLKYRLDLKLERLGKMEETQNTQKKKKI